MANQHSQKRRRRGRTPARLVEVIGMPGSGKTTLCNALSDSEQPRTLDHPFTQQVGWRGRARLVARAPTSSLLCYVAVASRRGSTRQNLYRVFLVQRARAALRATPAGGLVDEGPVHALFIAMFGTSETPLSRIALRWAMRALAGEVETYVYLDTPLQTCVDNFRRRQAVTSRFARHSSQTLIEDFLQDHTYEDLLTALVLTGGADVIEFHSSVDAAAFLQRRAWIDVRCE